MPPLSTPPHPRGTFVTKDEPTLTQHNYPESMVYLRVHSRDILWGLDECMRKYIHHYTIMQSIFSALRILPALPVHLRSLDSWQPLIFSLSPCLAFSRKNVILLESYSMWPFLDWLLAPNISVYCSSMSFHDLIAFFFFSI